MATRSRSGALKPPVEMPRFCRHLSERSPQPMVAVEGVTHIVSYVNPAFAKLVGKEQAMLVDRPFAEAVPEGSQNGCLALLDRVFRTGVPELLLEQEHRQFHPAPVYWSYFMWAILGEDDAPIGVMIQVTDSTEAAVFRQEVRAMNESLLISATRQHELADVAEGLRRRLQTAVHNRDHFLAVLSHELRTPLSALSSGLRLLGLDGTNPITAERACAMMNRQLTQLVRLVDDLLDTSRIATGKLELQKARVSLTALVRDSVQACRAAIDLQGHELILALPSDPIMLDADPTRLSQVFHNLLTNAAKYSEPGGQIRLTVERQQNEAIIRVSDTGIGISAEDLPHVFEAFVQVDHSWQRAQGGMGIGLSLVKEFVGLHGGRVDVTSEGLGKGSTFVVRLPVGATDVAESKTTANEPSRGPGRRILVVEDNRDAAESLAMVLSILGHEVHVAHDGEAGMTAAADFHPHLILLDLGMPKMDGYEVARQLRASPHGKACVLVALTGWGADDDRRKTREAGFDRHLIKPVDLNLLTKMIEEMTTPEGS